MPRPAWFQSDAAANTHALFAVVATDTDGSPDAAAFAAFAPAHVVSAPVMTITCRAWSCPDPEVVLVSVICTDVSADAEYAHQISASPGWFVPPVMTPVAAFESVLRPTSVHVNPPPVTVPTAWALLVDALRPTRAMRSTFAGVVNAAVETAAAVAVDAIAGVLASIARAIVRAPR